MQQLAVHQNPGVNICPRIVAGPLVSSYILIMALYGALFAGLPTVKQARSTSVVVQAMQKVDVAIIGGGPAGLLAAKAVSRACPKAVVQVCLGSSSGQPPVHALTEPNL